VILAVVGLQREARIMAGDGVRVVIGGGDAEGLARRLEEALQNSSPIGGGEPRSGGGASPPRRSLEGPSVASRQLPQGGGIFDGVVSFGVCGALAPGLKPGDLVVASAVRDGTARFQTDASWSRSIASRLPHAIGGTVAGSDVMLVAPEAKAALHGSSGAVAVDMESHIAARFAARRGLPLAVLRAVSDGANHALPPAAQRGLRPDGSMDIGAVLAALIADPRQLPALIRTGIEAEKGFSALVHGHHLLGPALGFGEFRHHTIDVT
jgi:adenosylhomocysteine nucleosidase